MGSRRPAVDRAKLAATLPPPDVSWDVDELARTAGVTVRTIRYYVEQGLLPAPEFKSWYTRYGRDYLVRLRAIARLRGQRLRLAAIRERLATTSPEELLRLAGFAAEEHASPQLPARGPVQGRPLPEGFAGPYRTAAAYQAERWEHIPLCPGVMILVRAEADPEAWRVAREVLATFGGEGSRTGSPGSGTAP